MRYNKPAMSDAPNTPATLRVAQHPTPNTLPAPLELLRELVALPGPPGQETAVRETVAAHVRAVGGYSETDAKGNLLATTGKALPEKPSVVVTAHLDEIALLVSRIEADESGDGTGVLRVQSLGGAHPWKWGEGPVEIMANGVFLPGLLSFGSIHTASPASAIGQARAGNPLTWEMTRVLTGVSLEELTGKFGVRPGSRVVLARSRRALWEMNGGLIASYFLDDRADLVAWLLAFEGLAKAGGYDDILFAATASEEVGGEGAQFLLHPLRPPVCVALEIGPRSPDAFFPLDATPTVWVTDGYAATDPRDLDLLVRAGESVGLPPLHFQALTRGGSDASCAASKGLCARPVTLAFGADNSHGFEVMHKDAPDALARLLVAYLRELQEGTGEKVD